MMIASQHSDSGPSQGRNTSWSRQRRAGDRVDALQVADDAEVGAAELLGRHAGGIVVVTHVRPIRSWVAQERRPRGETAFE